MKILHYFMNNSTKILIIVFFLQYLKAQIILTPKLSELEPGKTYQLIIEPYINSTFTNNISNYLTIMTSSSININYLIKNSSFSKNKFIIFLEKDQIISANDLIFKFNNFDNSIKLSNSQFSFEYYINTCLPSEFFNKTVKKCQKKEIISLKLSSKKDEQSLILDLNQFKQFKNYFYQSCNFTIDGLEDKKHYNYSILMHSNFFSIDYETLIERIGYREGYFSVNIDLIQELNICYPQYHFLQRSNSIKIPEDYLLSLNDTNLIDNFMIFFQILKTLSFIFIFLRGLEEVGFYKVIIFVNLFEIFEILKFLPILYPPNITPLFTSPMDGLIIKSDVFLAFELNYDYYNPISTLFLNNIMAPYSIVLTIFLLFVIIKSINNYIKKIQIKIDQSPIWINIIFDNIERYLWKMGFLYSLCMYLRTNFYCLFALKNFLPIENPLIYMKLINLFFLLIGFLLCLVLPVNLKINTTKIKVKDVVFSLENSPLAEDLKKEKAGIKKFTKKRFKYNQKEKESFLNFLVQDIIKRSLGKYFLCFEFSKYFLISFIICFVDLVIFPLVFNMLFIIASVLIVLYFRPFEKKNDIYEFFLFEFVAFLVFISCLIIYNNDNSSTVKIEVGWFLISLQIILRLEFICYSCYCFLKKIKIVYKFLFSKKF